MVKGMLSSALLAVPLAMAGGVSAAVPANAAVPASETRQFRGEGNSGFGFAYYYARGDALQKARNAGFSNCTEIDSYVSPGAYEAWVLVECTR